MGVLGTFSVVAIVVGLTSLAWIKNERQSRRVGVALAYSAGLVIGWLGGWWTLAAITLYVGATLAAER